MLSALGQFIRYMLVSTSGSGTPAYAGLFVLLKPRLFLSEYQHFSPAFALIGHPATVNSLAVCFIPPAPDLCTLHR